MPEWTREAVRALDGKDALAPLKKLFRLSAGVRYFNGNSLGLLSEPAERAVREVLEV
jgi:kynureninase